MKLLIRSPKIVCPASPHHLKTVNVLIQNGKIAEIGKQVSEADKEIRAEGMILSGGWFDLGALAGDPGHEAREDLYSLNKCAAAGGFTEVALLPNTSPVIQTKNDIAYLTQGNESRLVQVHPIGAVTRQCAGEELTEMIDLRHAGAVAFGDGTQPLWSTDILLKALQYLQPLNALLIDHAEDARLNKFGQAHEGPNAVKLGLKGMPRIAEEIAISRNIELLAYAGGRLHFSKISTAKSIELIRAAKKQGLQASCDMTAYQALLDDAALEDFDANYKVNPPLREKKDNEALIKGLKETIDVLCSGHIPLEEEEKRVEFEQAAFGIINWQTFASQLVMLSKWVPMEELIEKVTDAPRRLLNLPLATVEEEAKANLTLFDPEKVWTLNEASNLSKSKNSPWWDKPLKGKAVAVFNEGRQVIYL